jgi:hypothetical protein
MYCPYCGREMELIDGTNTCLVGAMPLSAELRDTLSDRFPVSTGRPKDAAVGRRRGNWFCPGCGVPLDPGMRCSLCGQSIRELRFILVEFHPHT